MINSHKIKAAINKESDAICKLLLHSFNKIISDKNNFEFIKKRELKILETMFENSEGYYVYSFEEFNHTYGFDKIDTYFDYAIRDIYPNQKLYEKLQHWRDDLPYTNGWALIFGAWKYYNHLIKLKNFDNLELTDQNIQVSIKLDSIKNYLPEPWIEKYHNCGNPEKCEYKEFSIEFQKLTDKDPNKWIAIGQNIGSGTLWSYLGKDFEKYKNEVLVTIAELTLDAKILFLTRFIKENSRDDEIDRKIVAFLKDELNKSILEKDNIESKPIKKIYAKNAREQVFAILLKCDNGEYPELKPLINRSKETQIIEWHNHHTPTTCSSLSFKTISLKFRTSEQRELFFTKKNRFNVDLYLSLLEDNTDAKQQAIMELTAAGKKIKTL